jgi:hypothetical protein
VSRIMNKCEVVVVILFHLSHIERRLRRGLMLSPSFYIIIGVVQKVSDDVSRNRAGSFL